MASSDNRPICKYGSACYHKNPQHLQQYSHPHLVNEGGNNIDLRKYKNAPCEGDIVKKRVIENEIPEDEKDATPTPKKTRPNSFTPVDNITNKNSDSDVEDSDDIRENIRKKFLIDMSEDFYQFWDFCCLLSPEDPINALHSTLQLVLVGPYDVLAGKLKGTTWHSCVLHCRFYYDPPELMTVLMRKGSEEDDRFHIGYFRDDPNAITDSFMVANCKGCVLTHVGLNIFAAVQYDIQEKLSNNNISLKLKKDLQSLEESLVKKAREFDLNLKDKKPPQRKAVAKCFHQIGISVPIDTALDIGYRPLPVSNKELQKLLDKIALCQDESKYALTSEPLEEMITLVQFANDECDYGMGLELGINLFCHGSVQLHNHTLRVLSLAYELLGREEYGKIIQKHLKNRNIIPLDLCKD